MKQRRRIAILVLLACVAAAGIVSLLWPREREPVYEGKPLSEWLEIANKEISGEAEAHRVWQAQDAIQHIGTNAVPFLLKWSDYDCPDWKNKLITSGASFMRRSPLFWRYAIGEKWPRAYWATHAFEILGSNAAGAVPELTRRMTTRNSESGRSAVLALGEIGREGLPALLSTATNPQALNRHAAIECIGLVMGRRINAGRIDAAYAIPALAKCVNDGDPMVACAAIRSLGELGIEPKIAVPALTKAVSDERADVRRQAIISLQQFGLDARPAVPVLVEQLHSPEFGVRSSATNALDKIAPEVLQNPQSQK